jgi:hypothetical protein
LQPVAWSQRGVDAGERVTGIACPAHKIVSPY